MKKINARKFDCDKAFSVLEIALLVSIAFCIIIAFGEYVVRSIA